VTPADTIALRIPVDPAFLSVARMFGGSVAKTFGLDAERTEDLRLALSEICAAAAEGGTDGGSSRPTIDIDVSWDETSLRFSCLQVPIASDGPRWMLIRALMPDLQVDGAEPARISFTVPR
jgi:anti-sigma regulatory factor (Ser/Thr protein kinase)